MQGDRSVMPAPLARLPLTPATGIGSISAPPSSAWDAAYVADIRRLYLDTGVLIAAMDESDGHHSACQPLIRAAKSGRVTLLWSSPLEYDLETAGAERRARRLTWLHERPFTTRTTAPFVLDVSRLDGKDVLSGDEETEAMTALHRLLVKPRAALNSGHSHRRPNLDLHHAYTAVMQRADLVTVDDDDLWKKRERIFAQAGLRVLHPQEAVRRPRTSKGKPGSAAPADRRSSPSAR